MKHPNKEINAVIQYAERKGWTVKKANGHAWATMRCQKNDSGCRCGKFCQMSVWSTPKNPGNFAKRLKKRIDDCIYSQSNEA